MTMVSRRGFMAGGLTLGAMSAVDTPAATTNRPERRLIAETRSLEVNDRAATIFRLADEAGHSGLFLAPGERFHVKLSNQTTDHTIIHWHGQLPPWTQDGFPWPQTPPLAPGTKRVYDYAPIPGTYWMHSHQGLQEQSLMTAPLIINDATELREDRQQIVLMLHDFSFTAPAALLAGLTSQTPSQIHAMARVSENVAASSLPKISSKNSVGMMQDMPGMGNMIPGHMGTKSKDNGMGSMDGMTMDLNDIDYDAFLANDRTLRDPAIVRVDRSGRVRLRIINGASSSQFWVDLGAVTGYVVAVDGHRVHPVAGRRFPLAIAQRLDILINMPGSGAFPILARLEGTRRCTGIVLATPGASVRRLEETGLDTMQPIDNSLETRLVARAPQARSCASDGSCRRHETLFLVAERGILASYHAADAQEGSTCRNRDGQPFDDGAPDAPSRPHVSGHRGERSAAPGGCARHRAGYANDGQRADRLRCQQSWALAAPLPQPLSHDDGHDDRGPLRQYYGLGTD